jgi:hypothetical protein
MRCANDQLTLSCCWRVTFSQTSPESRRLEKHNGACVAAKEESGHTTLGRSGKQMDRSSVPRVGGCPEDKRNVAAERAEDKRGVAASVPSPAPPGRGRGGPGEAQGR